MTIAFKSTRTQSPRPTFLLRLLKWLAAHDNAYRQNCKLRELPVSRLADMGMTRHDANTAFYRRTANRPADCAPITIRMSRPGLKS